MVSFERNDVLTHGKLTVSKMRCMDDGSWIGLREPWERLKWARLYWQGRTGSARTGIAAAESLGMKEDTYTAYERPPSASKHTPLSHQRAIQFGKKFKTNWVWILTGEETPFERTPAQDRAVLLLSSTSEEDQEELVAIMETLIRRKVG